MRSELSPQTTRRVTRFWPVVSGGVAVVSVLLLGLIVTLRATLPIEIDDEWMDDLVEERSPFWDAVAHAISWPGGGWLAVFVLPIGIAGILLLLRRPWSAMFAILAFALSAGLVQLLKHFFGRERPVEIMVSSDFGSFPSGHTANAATFGAILFILTWRWWVLLAGVAWTILMALSRTYLGAHWLTDTIGGMLLGAAVVILLWAPFAAKLREERDRPRQGGRAVGSVTP